MNQIDVDAWILDWLESNECVSSGHFEMASGMHSDRYVHIKAALGSGEVRSHLATSVVSLVQALKPTTVVAYSVGGIALAMLVAMELRVPLVAGHLPQFMGAIEWRPGLSTLEAGLLDRPLLLDDMMSTGAPLLNALSDLQKKGVEPIAAIYGVNRAGAEIDELRRVAQIPVLAASALRFDQWPASECPLCPSRFTHLPYSERDFLATFVSTPKHLLESVAETYEEVYSLQRDPINSRSVHDWRKWLSAMSAGVPVWQVRSDAALAAFVAMIGSELADDEYGRNVVSEIVGHLMAVASIRVEGRSVGCSLIVGRDAGGVREFTGVAPIDPRATVAAKDLRDLVPAYDALDPERHVFLFDATGALLEVRSWTDPDLVGSAGLRQFTLHNSGCAGFYLRRESALIDVYLNGALLATAQLSPSLGRWVFAHPGSLLHEISRFSTAPEHLLERLVEVCREMIARRYGGLFVIADEAGLIQHSGPSLISTNRSVFDLSPTAIAELAKIDGAVCVDAAGIIREVGTILHSASPVEPKQRLSVGSRSLAAFRASSDSPQAVVLSVSESGFAVAWVAGRPADLFADIQGLSG